MPKGIAITRAVSAAMGNCELTHLARVPIDVDLARAQHRAYEQVLRDAEYIVEQLASTDDMPDSVFVEDIAVVFDELAIITRPGAASRRAELPAVAAAISRHRPVQAIDAPATVDGGDVLVAGRQVFVGLSSRTTETAMVQLRRILAPHGYEVRGVAVAGCLHVKSAATALAGDTLLVNPEWVDRDAFRGFSVVEIDRSEPGAANALRLDDRVIVSASFPRTADRIERRGFRVERVDATEVAKAEGAVTCCSVIVRL